MKQLYEDNQPSKLCIRFSEQINQSIILIWEYNQNKQESLSQWYNYIEGIKRWLSNPSIAWDYANRFAKFPNGSRYIRDFNYNIGYTVKTNQYGAYVYVFMINLKPQDFGLKLPPTLKENKSKYTNNIMNTNKKVIRLSESKLKNIIAESVKRVLTESVWYGDIKPFETIIYACNEILNKFDYINNDDYEDWSDDGYDLNPAIYKWAERVKDETERWINCNSQNVSIGVGEGW